MTLPAIVALIHVDDRSNANSNAVPVMWTY